MIFHCYVSSPEGNLLIDHATGYLVLLDATASPFHPVYTVFGTSKGATTLLHEAELLAAATQLAGTGRGNFCKNLVVKHHHGE